MKPNNKLFLELQLSRFVEHPLNKINYEHFDLICNQVIGADEYLANVLMENLRSHPKQCKSSISYMTQVVFMMDSPKKAKLYAEHSKLLASVTFDKWEKTLIELMEDKHVGPHLDGNVSLFLQELKKKWGDAPLLKELATYVMNKDELAQVVFENTRKRPKPF